MFSTEQSSVNVIQSQQKLAFLCPAQKNTHNPLFSLTKHHLGVFFTPTSGRSAAW